MRTQSNTIPKATGSYFAASRGLIEQPPFLQLSAHARLVLYTLERMLPACGAATLHEPLVILYAGLAGEDVHAALADLEAAGWLIRDDGWWLMPYLLDPVQNKARGRAIYEARHLPDAVQAILRERHRWVMGRREKSVENSDASRLRVTDAGARKSCA